MIQYGKTWIYLTSSRMRISRRYQDDIITFLGLGNPELNHD